MNNASKGRDGSHMLDESSCDSGFSSLYGSNKLSNESYNMHSDTRTPQKYDSACYSMPLSNNSDSSPSNSSNKNISSNSSGYHSMSEPKNESTLDDENTKSFVHFLVHLRFLISTAPFWLNWDGKKDFTDQLATSGLNNAEEFLWKEKDEDGDFEALNAARDGDERVVAYAVYVASSWKVLNTKNDEKQTVLHVAAELCSAELVRLLVSRGADGAIPDLWGNTPLHIAVRLGRADVVKELTTRLTKDELTHPRFKVPYKSLPQDNKDQMNHDGKAPIHLAAQNRDVDCIHALADAKVDLDSRRLGDGFSPLHIVLDYGNYESANALLSRGADLEVRNHKGETPQQLAYLIHRHDLVNLCYKYDASPNQLSLAETEQVVYSSDEEMDWSSDLDELSGQVIEMSVQGG